MKYSPTAIGGVIIVDLEPIHDERGFFARTFSADEFAAHGLAPSFVQCSLSLTKKRGTIRGMHYQREPHGEAKLVRCLHGAIYDVVLDLRRESPSYLRWIAVDLNDRNRRALFLPPGVAHGFQTLTDDCEVWYQMSTRYRPESAAGVRWNDPKFAIEWPLPNPMLSEGDARYPDYSA